MASPAKRRRKRTGEDTSAVQNELCEGCDTRDIEIRALKKQIESPSVMRTAAKRLRGRRRFGDVSGEQSEHCTVGCSTRYAEIKTLKEHTESLQNKLNVMEQRCKDAMQARDEALTRLSALVSSRLRDNNPNICDLSDENRPTKIAERMSELYDNEWTDAYDELESSGEHDEVASIKILLDGLMDIYRACLKWATEGYFLRVQESIECKYKDPTDTGTPGTQDSPESGSESVLSTELRVEIKEIRKKRAMDNLVSIQKMLSERVPLYRKDVYQTPAMRRYITGCEQVCWLAAVQDPPLAIENDTPITYRRELFREYTRAGPHVQYMVWPLLRIQQGGALLSKGVVQCCSSPPGQKIDE